MATRIIGWVLRLALGAVFAFAGAVKIWDFRAGGSATQAFYEQLMNYQLVSSDVGLVVAVYLPWLELLVGMALLWRRLFAGGLVLAGAMTLVFVGALASAWWRGLDISCGCFGRETVAVNYPLHLAGNVVLLASVAFLWWREASRDSEKRQRRAPSQPGPTAQEIDRPQTP